MTDDALLQGICELRQAIADLRGLTEQSGDLANRVLVGDAGAAVSYMIRRAKGKRIRIRQVFAFTSAATSTLSISDENGVPLWPALAAGVTAAGFTVIFAVPLTVDGERDVVIALSAPGGAAVATLGVQADVG